MCFVFLLSFLAPCIFFANFRTFFIFSNLVTRMAPFIACTSCKYIFFIFVHTYSASGKSVCGNSLGLIRCDMCWDGVGQRGTWHETERGYLWILVGRDLNPVASVTVLLTEIWHLVDLTTADVWSHSD